MLRTSFVRRSSLLLMSISLVSACKLGASQSAPAGADGNQFAKVGFMKPENFVAPGQAAVIPGTEVYFDGNCAGVVAYRMDHFSEADALRSTENDVGEIDRRKADIVQRQARHAAEFGPALVAAQTFLGARSSREAIAALAYATFQDIVLDVSARDGGKGAELLVSGAGGLHAVQASVDPQGNLLINDPNIQGTQVARMVPNGRGGTMLAWGTATYDFAFRHPRYAPSVPRQAAPAPAGFAVPPGN
jgi:hypothetical protein